MSAALLCDLNVSAQHHATNLHRQVSQLLASSSDASIPQQLTSELSQLVSASTQLAAGLAQHQLTKTAGDAAAASEELEELQAASNKRQLLLQQLLSTLDDSSVALRAQLDACHKLLSTPPCKQDPEDIIRYAFTLRHGFAPLGSAPGQPQVPPAPQIPFMLHSTLRLYNMDLLAQQQQQQVAGVQAPTAAAQQQPEVQQQQEQPQQQVQQQQQPAAASTDDTPGQQQQQQQQELPQAQAQAQAQPAVQFMLNTDLLDDLGEEVTEEYSDEEYSDSA